ncbi:MAG: 2-iminoacetate synthase [Oceanotoga sp.]|uniref:Iron-only hydrogenase maturation protein HydG n=1 Tax=Oceanotoga teriensis TaxID=515440 RepID=A0AA45C4X3_9BACT|nr:MULTISPECIES: [FeFe] hydrogenase H-cluster radical SAM maturase HydG [Oceanotoga]MDN5342793.1 2-iminoacetate synthase [Oceanotoga sp.]PWJ87549.1 iron-only hydrogenase maturation protein HydG [Oceanotoga teriensis]
MFYIKDSKTKTFIDDEKISTLLQENINPDPKRVEDIIQKSLDKNRLNLEEMSYLLNCEDERLENMIFDGAKKLKEKVYGNRIVLFAPMYIGNECINDCEYCGFRVSNKEIFRNSLSIDEVKQETKALIDRGHKRLILVYGEHPMYDAKFIAKTVEAVYSVKSGHGNIRRVNINAAPQTIEGFKIIHDAGIGTFQVFQETYHEKTFKKIHPRGPKSSYRWRLYSLDRAFGAGIDDVGIGALFGMYDWKYEMMGLLSHAIHFEERFNVGPHTISFPRIEPALNTPVSERPPYIVDDKKFKKLVAILRLAVPYTGLILTAREPISIRNDLMEFGVSQIDAGSNIGVGAYSTQDKESYKKSQFVLGDQRSLDEVIKQLTDNNFLPSFCTGCYRLGRTGEHFMEFAIPGFVKRFCTPNAISTLMEYVVDYASDETKNSCLKVINNELKGIKDINMKEKLLSNLEKIKSTDQRDLYF